MHPSSALYLTEVRLIEHRCHGGAIFPGIIDSSTGKSVIAGRKVTSFTTRGEEEGVLDTIKNWSRPTIESSAAAACGANCKLAVPDI